MTNAMTNAEIYARMQALYAESLTLLAGESLDLERIDDLGDAAQELVLTVIPAYDAADADATLPLARETERLRALVETELLAQRERLRREGTDRFRQQNAVRGYQSAERDQGAAETGDGDAHFVDQRR